MQTFRYLNVYCYCEHNFNISRANTFLVAQGFSLARTKYYYVGVFLLYNFLGEIISGKDFLYGPFHFLVPQSVDERVEEWRSQCVHQGDELILLGVVARVWAQVHEGTAAIL